MDGKVLMDSRGIASMFSESNFEQHALPIIKKRVSFIVVDGTPGGHIRVLKEKADEVRALSGILFHFIFCLSNVYGTVFRYAILIQTFMKVSNLLISFLGRIAIGPESGIISKELWFCSINSISPDTCNNSIGEI